LMLVSLLLPPQWAPRLAGAAAVVVLMIGGVAVTDATLRGVHSIPSEPGQPAAVPATTGSAGPTNFFAPGQTTLPAMQDEIGADVGGAAGRTMFGSSGRAVAWKGAIEQGLHRPILGYGFGTEERVFVDRFYFFQSARAENSYIGFFLQLGVVGVAGFVLLALGLLRRLVRTRTDPQAIVLGCTVLGGYLLACVQSYAYSVGNIATLPLWLCALLLLGIPAGRETYG
jgi:O-antigen ligase